MTAYEVTPGDNRPFNLGDWCVEPALNRLSGEGVSVRVEPKAMAGLVYLAANANRVVSGDELIAEIWNGHPMGDTPVYKCIAQLRKALGDDPRNPTYIATVPKKGYRLIAPVVAPEAGPPAVWRRRPPSSLPDFLARIWRWSLPVTATAVALVAAVVFFASNDGDEATGSATGPRDADADGVTEFVEAGPEPGLEPACGDTKVVDACRRYRMAQAHLRHRDEGFGEQAVRLLEDAIALDPGFAAAHAYLGYAYLAGRPVSWAKAVDHADTAIQRALELNPDLPETHLARGLSLLVDRRCPPPDCRNLRALEQAELIFRQALSLRPEYSDARNMLAFVLWNRGKLDEAYSQLNAGLTYDPLNPLINSSIAVHKAFLGDYSGAVSTVREFTESYPGAPHYMHRLLADLECRFGKFDTCVETLYSLPANSPEAGAGDLLREAYLNLGLFDETDGVLSRQAVDGLCGKLARAHGRLLIAQGRFEELEAYSAALADDVRAKYGPEAEWPAWPLRTLGYHMFALGDYERAVLYLARYHGLEGAVVDYQMLAEELNSLHALAYSLTMTGRAATGEALLAHSVSLLDAMKVQGYDGYPGHTFAEARAYVMQGRNALAVATLRKAVAEGWRHHHRAVIPGDPRWNPIRGDVDYEKIFARVRGEVDEMRERTIMRFERVTASTSVKSLIFH